MLTRLAWTQYPIVGRGHRLLHCAMGAVFIALANTVHAQALVVVVTDSTRATPVDGALVSLLDQTADLVSAQRTGATGRVRLKAWAGAGHYALRVESSGYQGLITNWIPVANTDTLEITIRLRRVAALPEVVITSARDSITSLLPPGVTRRGVSRIVMPDEIERHNKGAGDYVDVLASIGIPSLTTGYSVPKDVRFARRCLTTLRSVALDGFNGAQACVRIYVNNTLVDLDSALDLAHPANLDFAVWVPASEAGVLYGTDALNGVLLLYTKDWRRAQSVRPPEWQ